MYEATFPIAEVLVSILSIFAAALLAIVFYMFRDLGKRIATTNSTLEEHRKETKADINALRQETKTEFDKVNDRFDKVNDQFGEVRREFNDRFDYLDKRVNENSNAISELKGITSALLSLQTGTAGEDESSGPPEQGRR